MDSEIRGQGLVDDQSVGLVKLEPQNIADIQCAKRKEIHQACRDRNIEELVSLATSHGGLLQDDLRKAVCMTTVRIFVGSRHSLSVN
jgi:hypothetical protein